MIMSTRPPPPLLSRRPQLHLTAPLAFKLAITLRTLTLKPYNLDTPAAFFFASVSKIHRRIGLPRQKREQDFYDGHSWTSGLFSQGDGKSQESVSESINAYYGVYLLGLAVGDTGMRDWGRVLLAMEMRGARKYWQMPDNNGVRARERFSPYILFTMSA